MRKAEERKTTFVSHNIGSHKAGRVHLKEKIAPRVFLSCNRLAATRFFSSTNPSFGRAATYQI
jgi:hypothetical protein